LTASDFVPWGAVIPDFNANTMIAQTNFTIEVNMIVSFKKLRWG